MTQFRPALLRPLLLLWLMFLKRPMATKITFVNHCDHMVWPTIITDEGCPSLQTTGFELNPNFSRSFYLPTGWRGRIWARTGCSFNGSRRGTCVTGECRSRAIECDAARVASPATEAGLVLGVGAFGEDDSYYVGVSHGFNLPMILAAINGTGKCPAAGCAVDLNPLCPPKLRVAGGKACKSPCQEFRNPEKCCTGEYHSRAACKPSTHLEGFRQACPRLYSYPYDTTSILRCSNANYTVSFCPFVASKKFTKKSSYRPKARPESGAMGGSGYKTMVLQKKIGVSGSTSPHAPHRHR
ncbi:hypothetical protein NMG60_11019446 [Bertholletia excelsa]